MGTGRVRWATASGKHGEDECGAFWKARGNSDIMGLEIGKVKIQWGNCDAFYRMCFFIGWLMERGDSTQFFNHFMWTMINGEVYQTGPCILYQKDIMVYCISQNGDYWGHFHLVPTRKNFDQGYRWHLCRCGGRSMASRPQHGLVISTKKCDISEDHRM